MLLPSHVHLPAPPGKVQPKSSGNVWGTAVHLLLS